MKDSLYDYLSQIGDVQTLQLNIFSYIEIMSIALVLAFLVFFTYKLTYSGVLYNRKFNISLVMLTLVTTMVIIVIGSDIALSLGMVGALSIVRFRTAIKDPRDTGYIFWVIGIGLVVGTQNYLLGVVASLFIALTLFVFRLGSFGNDNRYLLIIRAKRERELDIEGLVFKYFRDSELRGKNTTQETIEIIYQVKFKTKASQTLVQDIYQIEGVHAVNIVAQNGETIG